jgi:short-subunit dehydrogenase
MHSEDIQNLVITGANEGIGYETMKALYLTGKFNVIFGSRNMNKNREAKTKLL